MTKEAYEAGIAAGVVTTQQQAQVNGAIDQQMNSDAVKTTVSQSVETQMQSADVTALIDAKTEEQVKALIDQNMNSADVQQQITQALEQANSGAASISALKTQLDSYNEFYKGLLTYTAGVADASKGAGALQTGAGALKNGTDSLYAGTGTLYDGIAALQNGSSALTSGVKELRDGSMKLSDGLKEFNEQGVQKLVDAVDGDLGGLVTRLRATVDVSKNYKSFAGISDDMDGQVKFIYRTESVKTEK
jgi:putative membrane protein